MSRRKAFYTAVIPRLTSWCNLRLPIDNLEALETSLIFSEIYDQRLWGRGQTSAPFSGPGSHNSQTVDPYISAVRKFIFDTFVTPPDVVDLGCGDFNVGRQIRNATSRYIACDIVPQVVNYNRLIFARDDVDFRVLDMVTEDLPAGDVVFIRQVLQHLSNRQIVKLIPKLKTYKWLVVTESLPYEEGFEPNHDIETGEFIRIDSRSGVDLTKSPFLLGFHRSAVLSEVVGAYHKDGELDRIRTTAYQLSGV